MNSKILIVEDEGDLREVLSELFKENNFTVFQAENGRQGMAILESIAVDCVLTDVQMPVMNGMDFLKASKTKFGDKPPVFIMTAGSVFSKTQFYAAGADGYFDKPINVEAMIHTFRSLTTK